MPDRHRAAAMGDVMRQRGTGISALALALSLSLTAIAPAAEYDARTEQRHEVAAGHGPAGVRAAVIVGKGQNPQDVTLRHEVAARGLPSAPDGPPAPDGAGQTGTLTLPNLAPLPPYDIYIGHAEQPQGPVWSNLGSMGAGEAPTPKALRFTTTIQNRGAFAFELAGTPWVPDPEHPDLFTTQAYQCVRFEGPVLLGTPRLCQRYDSVGTLTWHAQHRHFHINGFGRYELRRDAGNGTPDLSPAGLVGASQKQGWCVSDMYQWREDDDAPAYDGAAATARDGWYSECTDPVLYTGASWRQGISPMWADTYPAAYTGQEIPISGVTDGVYWIVTTINPKDNEFGLRVQETTYADNISGSRIQIYAGGSKARLLSPMPAKPYADWFDNPEDQPGN